MHREQPIPRSRERFRHTLGTFLLIASPILAQPPVAPTDLPVGITRGENTAAYNIRQSFELGYRFRSVGGDEDMYRATVNYGNGLRLLSSSLSINSLDGRGGWFDQIQLNTQGLGNDPYQYAGLRAEKNKIYKYDLTWRSNAYVNQGLRAAEGRHPFDTVRNMQDHDLILLPQSPFKVFLGYSRNTQSGPAVTSELLFGARDDAYPLLADLRRAQHEYRLGFEATAMGYRLNVLHGWVNFKDDSPVRLAAPSAGYNPDDLATLDSQTRAEPYHGNSPYWRIALFKETRLWAVNGRFTYVNGRRSFVDDQTAMGTSRIGIGTTRQIITLGDARRPSAAGNLNLMFFPGDRVTLTNQTTAQHTRMEGNSLFTQIDNGAARTPFMPFTFLGIRTIANSTDLDVRLARWFAVRAGYQYSTRRIRSIEGVDQPGNPAPDSVRVPIEQTNRLHTGLLGLRIRPVSPLTINLDAEIGRADRPIYPVSARNYQAFRGRIEYKDDAFRLAGFARTDYNTNSASLANYASRSRQYGADATWTIGRDFFVDAGYSKLHLDTLGTINYFANTGSGNQLVTTDRSLYISNLHTATVMTRFAIGPRADVALGVSHVQDTGDGRSGPFAATNPNASVPAFAAAQTFPLSFTSPQGRLSVLLSEKLRWNLGYQHYGYGEDFRSDLWPSQGYRAHTGYTSVLWSF